MLLYACKILELLWSLSLCVTLQGELSCDHQEQKMLCVSMLRPALRLLQTNWQQKWLHTSRLCYES